MWNDRDLGSVDLNNFLFAFKMRQSQFERERNILPQSFYEFVSLLVAFWNVLFMVGTQTLKPYVRFQFNKNRIKDLYFYSRTKKGQPNMKMDEQEMEQEDPDTYQANELKNTANFDG